MSDQRSVAVDDAQMVMWSADILEKSEFELFELAYQAWYRETADTTRMERIFVEYMFDGIVPFWVRQFARSTLDACDGWREHEQIAVGEYLLGCLRGVSTTLLATAGLALSLFVPHMVFPWIEADYAALPA